METYEIIIFLIIILIVGIVFYFTEYKPFLKSYDALEKTIKESEELRIKCEQECAHELQLIKENNTAISSCTCDNIFNFSRAKKGYHNYTDKLVGVRFANITIQKTLDCYVKLVSTEYDESGYGIEVFSMNDIHLGWLPKNSPLKVKLSHIMNENDKYYGYAVLNKGNNIKSTIKLRLSDEVMIND